MLTVDASRHREPEPAVAAAFRERVAVAAGVRNAADGALVAVMVDALENDLWQGSRIHVRRPHPPPMKASAAPIPSTSTVQWLMWRAGVSRHTARQVVRLAVRSPELPVTLGLLGEGRLSLDQAATVARYAPAEFEASVCNLAQNATVPQIVTATRRYCFDVDNPDGEKPTKTRPRSVSFGADDDGTWWARIRLHADEGQVVEEALKTTRDRLHDTAREKAKERAAAEGRSTKGTDAELGVAKVGWADALVGMAHSVVGTNAAGAETGAKAAVHLHLEHPEPGCGEQWRAELHGGPALPTWLRRYLLCDCDIEIVWADDGIPVVHSRTHRTPPRRIRREIERRDGYVCRVPGCDSTLWLQVHHIIHWEDDGETLTWNLVCLCAHHHRAHHQGLLGIVGNADDVDGLTFTNPHGLVLDPAGRPRAPTPGDMPTVAPYQGPTGERLRKHDVWFNRTRPTGAPAREPAA